MIDFDRTLKFRNRFANYLKSLIARREETRDAEVANVIIETFNWIKAHSAFMPSIKMSVWKIVWESDNFIYFCHNFLCFLLVFWLVYFAPLELKCHKALIHTYLCAPAIYFPISFHSLRFVCVCELKSFSFFRSVQLNSSAE